MRRYRGVMVEITQRHDRGGLFYLEKALAWLRESHIDQFTAAATALAFVPIATAKALRASIALCQRASSAKTGRSTGKSRHRFTIGASAMSAMVSRSSAKKLRPARWPSRILSWATRSPLWAAKSPARSVGGFLASLNTDLPDRTDILAGGGRIVHGSA